jgi:hypothetical protein
MTPEERIRYKLQGVANLINRALDRIEERQRMVRPTTPEDIEREERRVANSWRAGR